MVFAEGSGQQPAVHRVGGGNGMQMIQFGALTEDLTWILSHFARDVHSGEPLGSILAGPSPKLPVRN